MFTINFKSKSGSPDVNHIRIEMIFYRPGYARVPKITNVRRNAKDRDEKTQMFHSEVCGCNQKTKPLQVSYPQIRLTDIGY
jgi:hypothetical protein